MSMKARAREAKRAAIIIGKTLASVSATKEAKETGAARLCALKFGETIGKSVQRERDRHRRCVAGDCDHNLATHIRAQRPQRVGVSGHKRDASGVVAGLERTHAHRIAA